MKATGIVRRIDDLGRVVIPKEIRRTMRIREGDPSQATLTQWERFCFGMMGLSGRLEGKEAGAQEDTYPQGQADADMLPGQESDRLTARFLQQKGPKNALFRHGQAL